VLPTADVLLAPREETLSDLLLNGGERIALAEFGTIQVPSAPTPVRVPPARPPRGLFVRWPGRGTAWRRTRTWRRPADAGSGPDCGPGHHTTDLLWLP